ncbi:MAG: hypothetical protein DRP59_11095 [Spirochaetes bacterium]|nr:MAG: hypothetical protein DRP59_11095 [Spirochaetota bacterium]
MTREDFVFSVGYQGIAAIVDKSAKNKYGKLSTTELAEKGLFRAALCSALYAGSEEETRSVTEIYNSRNKADVKSPEDMKRLLGVFGVPDNITKIIAI